MAYVVEDRITAAAVETHSGMSWGAIIAGWLIATAVAGLLYVGGLALGFSAFDAREAGGHLEGIGIGSVLWIVLTWVVALFLGGMFASWFDGRADETTGTLHGLTVWGLSLSTTALALALGLGHAAHGGPRSGEGPGVPAAVAAGGGDIAVLHADIAHLIASPERHEGRDDAAPIVAALLASRGDEAANDRTANALLAADTAMTPTEASAALQRLSPQIVAARSEAKATADLVANRTAKGLWAAFASAFLGLIAAALGGWFGAGRVHRVYHLRRYEGRPFRQLP